MHAFDEFKRYTSRALSALSLAALPFFFILLEPLWIPGMACGSSLCRALAVALAKHKDICTPDAVFSSAYLQFRDLIDARWAGEVR